MIVDIINSLLKEPKAVLITLPLGLLAYFLIYPLYFGKLSHVPGPPITALTKYWILYQTWNEKRIRLVHQLHKKYGPIVRLSPCEVSVSDPELIKTIYVGNYDKSSFYGQFGAYGKLNTFSSLNKSDHIKRRKMLNQLYSKTSISSAPVESMTQKRVKDAMDIIDRSTSAAIPEKDGNKNPERSIDVYNIFHALAMDTVTGFILGPDNGSKFLITQDYSMIENYRLQSAMWFWTTLMPQFYNTALDKVTKLATEATAAWCKENTLKSAKSLVPGTVISQLDQSNIRGLEACAESQDHTAAGHETTGATLSFLTYHLSIDQPTQTKLRSELVEALGPGGENTFKEVDSLPYLNGVIMETLRLYSAIPGAEPRITPKKGMIHGQLYVPADIVVSVQPWTVHRDPDAYPDPLAFRPERWYQSSPDQMRKMNRNFMAFGAGVRMCIGMNLAMQEMKLMVASIYSKYSTTVSPHFDGEKQMYMVDKYTTHPLGHECLLDFHPLDDAAKQ